MLNGRAKVKSEIGGESVAGCREGGIWKRELWGKAMWTEGVAMFDVYSGRFGDVPKLGHVRVIDESGRASSTITRWGSRNQMSRHGDPYSVSRWKRLL